MICNRLDETGWRWLRQHVELLPIPLLSSDKQQMFIEAVRQELGKITKKGKDAIECLITETFDFTREEEAFLKKFAPRG